MKKLIGYNKNFKFLCSYFPLTGRGLIFLSFSMLITLLYAIPEADLISAIIGSSTIIIIFLCTLGVFLSFLRTKERIAANFNFPNNRNRANSNFSVGIVLENINIFPFITLFIDKIFTPENSKVNYSIHLFRGSSRNEKQYFFIDNISFPHRGIWKLQSLNFRLEDVFGFSSISWNLDTSAVLEILPPENQIKPLPIIASSTKEGEDASVTLERTGDLFDTKQYDPSDGIKKILWKSYARSRALIVRRPEPAQIPEGEVAIFMANTPDNDHVAGAIESYIEFLSKNNVRVIFGGTDSGLIKKFSSEQEEIIRAICASGTNYSNSNANEFSDYLSAIRTKYSDLYRVIIFSDEAFIKDKKSAYSKIYELATSRHINLCLVIVPKDKKTSYPKSKYFLNNLIYLKKLENECNNNEMILNLSHDQQVIFTERNIS